jgi:hypothetical protein
MLLRARWSYIWEETLSGRTPSRRSPRPVGQPGMLLQLRLTTPDTEPARFLSVLMNGIGDLPVTLG